jgi:ubiquinone/menaquinone biosynthesis C-methylase UbiE
MENQPQQDPLISTIQFFAGSDLQVRAYDALLNPLPNSIIGDVALYTRLAREVGGSVLEIGVGTGRVCLALAEAGITVAGLDASEGMLKIAEAKRDLAGFGGNLKLVLGDMRAFDFDERFDAVIVPYCAFQHMLTPSDQRKALAAFCRHIRPGGFAIIHMFDPNLHMLAQGGRPVTEQRKGVISATDETVEATLEQVELDFVQQLRKDQWRYRSFNSAGLLLEEKVFELVLRWTYRWEMRHLFELAGYTVQAEYSDFDLAPPAYGKEQVWIVCPK